MQVTVTGATGVIGRRLIQRFTDAGHDVVGLVRDEGDRELVTDRGGQAVVGDVLEPVTLESAVDDAEVIVHAATSIPTDDAPDRKDWAHNARVRVDGARHVLDAAGDRLERLLVPSVVWVARQPDGSPFDESSPRHPDIATQSAADLEELVDEADVASTVLRLGFLYAPDAAHTRDWGRRLLDRDLPVVGTGLLGRGETALSMLHADDAADAFVAALDAEVEGVYHVVDDQPVTTATLFGHFAEILSAPSPRRFPGWLARWFLGDAVYRTLTVSMPTNNDRFAAATGWSPAYPSIDDGLAQVVETWRDTGILMETDAGYRWVNDQSSSASSSMASSTTSPTDDDS